MKLTTYPGDIIHRVAMSKEEGIYVKSERCTRKHHRSTYWGHMAFKGPAHGIVGRNDRLLYDGFPLPESAAFIILVKRPWYNHLRALLGI